LILSDLYNRLHAAYLEEVYTKPFAKKNQGRKISAQNTIALVCHPRGGSNWLGEIVSHIQGTVLFHEPLWRGFYRAANYKPTIDEGKIKQISKLEFYFDQPIPYNAQWEEARATMESILKGDFWNYDLYDKNKIENLKNSEIHIIKFCYGHLLLPWLHRQFDFKTIVLHRHPCAVIASQLNHMGFSKIIQNPSGDLPDFRYNEIYKEYKHIWKRISSKEEYLAAIWALKTKYICESSIDENKWLTIFYEELISNFNEQIEKIGNHLNTHLPDTVFKIKNKPSTSTPNRNHLRIGERQLSKWETILSEDQINKILKIVEKFGIELYDSAQMPHTKKSK